jgi:IclR family transcriptional regulator, KDG regulon repressor
LTSKENKKTLKSYSVPAIQRMLDLIEAMATANHELTITEANRKFKIPKSSVYSILQTLKSRGYIDKDKEDRYFLTLKIFSLGSTLVDSLDLRGRIYPLLKEMTEKARITGHIAVLDDGYAVYIEKVEVLGAVRLTTWVGKRMHVHSTAIGKALVAYFSDEEIEQYVERYGLQRLTDKTITNLRDFKKELARVRANGYSTANEENESSVRAIAAPVLDHAGNTVAAVNLGGSTLQIKTDNLQALGELVRTYALKMSRALGYRGPNRG